MSMKNARNTIIGLAVAALSPAVATVATISLTATPGCFVFGSPGPSAVGQGREYKSGDPTFDAFFDALHDVQVQMAEAPDEEKAIRRALAKKLDTDADASARVLAEKTKQRAHSMAAHGIALKLETDEGDAETKAKADLHASGGAPAGADKRFVTAVEAAVQKELELARQMKKSSKLLEQLRASTAALDANIDTTFRLGGPRKKSEVRKNLDDAKLLMPMMNARADEVRDAAMETAKKLTDAVETDDGNVERPAPPAEPEPTQEPKHKQGKPAAKSKPKPAQGTAAPRPAPAPKPAPKASAVGLRAVSRRLALSSPS